MLRDSRTVLLRLCLARWSAGGARNEAFIRIEIEGTDPRIVVVPRIWIERVLEPSPDAPSGVHWTTYSAGLDSKTALIPLQVVDGTLMRPVRVAATPDGTIPQGDSLELQTATPLIVVVECADVSATLPDAAGQSLWFALDCYPADPSLQPADFDDLLHKIRCSQPAAVSLQAAP
jgi:hypothetical protein